jgi:hypothetical protein
MASRRRAKVVFPADIHRIAADIRRQALQHPDRDPVVPRTGRARPKRAKATARKGKTARRKTTRKRSGAGTTRARRK